MLSRLHDFQSLLVRGMGYVVTGPRGDACELGRQAEMLLTCAERPQQKDPVGHGEQSGNFCPNICLGWI